MWRYEAVKKQPHLPQSSQRAQAVIVGQAHNDTVNIMLPLYSLWLNDNLLL